MTRARPCTCDRFTPGPYRPGDCRPCWLAAHDERYRRLWGVSGPVAPAADHMPAPDRARPCRRLWPCVLEFAACGCDEKHVRGCDLFDRCTLSDGSSLLPRCDTCPEYDAGTSGRAEP